MATAAPQFLRVPLVSACLILLSFPGWSGKGLTTSPAGLKVPGSADLAEDGPRQRRWLSIPDSRIVVNPLDYWVPTRPVEVCPVVTLPLDVGYHTARTAVRLDSVLELYERTAHPDGEVTVGWGDDFRGPELKWEVPPNAEASLTGSAVRLKATGPMKGCTACTYFARTVEIDFDRHPWLRIDVPRTEGKWAVKVADLEGNETTLQSDTSVTGTVAFNVAEATGWRGRRAAELRFFAIGLNQPVTLASVQAVGIETPVRSTARECRTTWTPHRLHAEAQYSSARVETGDFFHDTDTLIREWSIAPVGTSAVLTLSGMYSGVPRWDPENLTLSVESTTATWAIALQTSGPVESPLYARSVVGLLAGDLQTEPPGQGIWALDIPVSGSSGTTVVTSVAFAPAGERSVAEKRAVSSLRSGGWRGKALAREREWDAYLRSVPHPGDFSLSHIDPLGVTAEDVRKAYYKAWVFLAANLLPAMPEAAYPYPQQAAGKPSLWLEGHPKAPSSASWESLLAMQLWAHIDPRVAWEAYKGHISLVDESGRLGGESLPSRKAQTARVLYELTGDAQSVREVWPLLKRHLLWARDNPRWIHGSHDYADEKDADFVVSLLFDMAQMEHLAAVLNMPEEKRFWESEREKLLADYRKWFWESPEQESMQIYFTGSGKRRYGVSLWAASGLYLEEIGEGPHLEGLKRRFRSDFKPHRPFAGFNLPKAPEMAFLVRGLVRRGMAREAAIVANAAIRDVTRANMFAEQYFVKDFPDPDGVRPSVFGAAMLIDMIWLKNGCNAETGRCEPFNFVNAPAN